MKLKLNLYIGIPIADEEEMKHNVINVVNERHPDCSLEAIVDGYWSGVEESTLHIKVECELSFAQDTIEVIRQFLPDGFVALDEVESE